MGRVLVLLSVFCLSSLQGAPLVPTCRTLISNRPLSAIQRDVHGGDPLAPTPKSRLGRYLAQTGAKTFIHRFARNRSSGKGEEKLVVLVSAETFPAFAKLFGKSFPNGFEHLHTPRQGTLLMRWMDRTVSYARVLEGARGSWRFPTPGSIGPVILLSDSETKRLRNYLALTTPNNNLRMPNIIPGYGYPTDLYIGNCTAWVGHIPVGDETVSELTVPANQDGPKEQRQPPIRGELSAYNAFSALPPYLPQPLAPAQAKLLDQVWSTPLHKPLFEVLGVPLRLANHTNPGWVALSLTGIVSAERVPFVILYTEDHTTVPKRFQPQIHPVGP